MQLVDRFNWLERENLLQALFEKASYLKQKPVDLLVESKLMNRMLVSFVINIDIV